MRKILIVDDVSTFRELEALVLARSGWVATARDGAEGLATARRERPDVVVANLNLPSVDGEALCKELKADPALREVPVILVVSGEDAEDRARAVRAGADDVLEKPIDRVALIEAVNRFLCVPLVRGPARVDLDAPVRIHLSGGYLGGRVRNLSRGGLFVEAECSLPVNTRVTLEFQLPETKVSLSPSAQVVWQTAAAVGGQRGMGLRFLALDRTSARQIDAFVLERAAGKPLPALPPMEVPMR